MHEIRPAGNVDRDLHQCLIQRHQCVAEAGNAGAVTERLRERRSQGDRGVLDSVMRIDLQVTVGAHGQVETTVLSELTQHVVVEANAGGDIGTPGAIEIKLQTHLRLAGHALDPADSAHAVATFSSASKNAVVSGSVPAVTRNQPGSPTSRISTPSSSNARHVAPASANPPNSTKLASLGTDRSPSRGSSAMIRSRCALISSTVASRSGPCARATRAAAWVSADR